MAQADRDLEEEVRYSVKNGQLTEKSTEEERYEILKNAELEYVSVDYEKIKDVNIEEYNTRKKSAVVPGLKAIADTLGIANVDLYNSKIEFPFQFSKKNIEKSAYHQLEYGGTYQDYVKAMSCFKEIVLNAIPIEMHNEKKTGTSRENKNLETAYVLVSAFRDGKKIPVELEVKKFRGRNSSLYMTVMLTKIDLEVVETGVSEKIGNVPSLFSRSIISLQQFFKNVNPQDGRFLKYVPDGFLSNEQKEAKQTAFEKQNAEYASYDTPKNSLRNQQPIARDILMETDPQTQKNNVKGHLTRYQERVVQPVKAGVGEKRSGLVYVVFILKKFFEKKKNYA